MLIEKCRDWRPDIIFQQMPDSDLNSKPGTFAAIKEQLPVTIFSQHCDAFDKRAMERVAAYYDQIDINVVNDCYSVYPQFLVAVRDFSTPGHRRTLPPFIRDQLTGSLLSVLLAAPIITRIARLLWNSSSKAAYPYIFPAALVIRICQLRVMRPCSSTQI